jgi:hypothetical protein
MFNSNLTPEETAELIVRRVRVNLSSELSRKQVIGSAWRILTQRINYTDPELQKIYRLYNFQYVLLCIGYVKKVLGENLTIYDRQDFETRLGALKSRLVDFIKLFGIENSDLSILDKINEADDLLTNYIKFKQVKDVGLGTVSRLVDLTKSSIIKNRITQTDQSIRQSQNLHVYLRLKYFQNAIEYKLSLIEPGQNVDVEISWKGLAENVSQLLNVLIQEDPVICEYNFANDVTKNVIRKTIRLAFVKKILES